ncbi:MAG: penicillin acylase family protein [Acidobacteria bacterium]|nr:penicillin acylase family protein [Acidobacteriota bacterium]
MASFQSKTGTSGPGSAAGQRRTIGLTLLLALAPVLPAAETVTVKGLKQPVEILRDRWGVPHIYAANDSDLFFAQGYLAARDRLFQLDLWRRQGTGRLAEVLGPVAVNRDRIARLVRYRGNWDAEWSSYSPDTRAIAVAFTSGINAYIDSLRGRRTIEFEAAGFDPGKWQPEDVVARVAGLLMTRNIPSEVQRSLDTARFGVDTVQRLMPPDPFLKLEVPRGLNLADIRQEILKDYNDALAFARFPDQGSNNWVMHGSMTATGKPLLANDPHRPILNPSLRKTVHLVAPGWNAIGAGEPALPGVSTGHNEEVAWGYTIVGIDQNDLYVEKINPANPGEYLDRGQWRRFETETQRIEVKGEAPRTVELRYTHHGPVIYEDRARNRAYALKWVGTEPGTAGYLAGLAMSRARNWSEFKGALDRHKVPSLNFVYADRAGNIGWVPRGLTPIRTAGAGLYPVPGDTGEYEWKGFLTLDQHPQKFNPPEQWIGTANHNILPAGYPHRMSHEWAQPWRYDRIREMVAAQKDRKFTVDDFIRMQQDVTSLPARRLQGILRKWDPEGNAAAAGVRQRLLAWDARLMADSVEATLFEAWLAKLPAAVFPEAYAARVPLDRLFGELEARPNPKALAAALDAALKDLEKRLGADRAQWQWGKLHTIIFRHPSGRKAFDRGPVARPGDGNTVNSTSGTGFVQTNGASYRHIMDLADWDRSVVTNVPGESGDPASPYYSNLVDMWAAGQYHPLPYSRKAVEAATAEKILLKP